MIEDDYDDQVIMTLYHDHMTVTAHDEQCSFVFKALAHYNPSPQLCIYSQNNDYDTNAI